MEKEMDLPEDIRLKKIEASKDKDIFIDVVNRLQSERVVIVNRRWTGTPDQHPKGALTQSWCSKLRARLIPRQSGWLAASRVYRGRTFGALRA
jgi:hypothetical protein